MFRHRLFFPIVNFIVSSTGLYFQTTVLLPWHNEISKQIMAIQKLLIDKT